MLSALIYLELGFVLDVNNCSISAAYFKDNTKLSGYNAILVIKG